MEAIATRIASPGTIASALASGETEITVAYTEFESTRALLDRAAALTSGEDLRIRLIAVHVVPFPADFECHSREHAFLVDQLIALSAGCAFPVAAEVVLARSVEEGFRHALPRPCTVLVANHNRLWTTWEEHLADGLSHEGHKVFLVPVA